MRTEVVRGARRGECRSWCAKDQSVRLFPFRLIIGLKGKLLWRTQVRGRIYWVAGFVKAEQVRPYRAGSVVAVAKRRQIAAKSGAAPGDTAPARRGNLVKR